VQNVYVLLKCGLHLKFSFFTGFKFTFEEIASFLYFIKTQVHHDEIASFLYFIKTQVHHDEIASFLYFIKTKYNMTKSNKKGIESFSQTKPF